MKIYIVKAPQGEYEDYREPIVKVFADKGKAEEYVKIENAELQQQIEKKEKSLEYFRERVEKAEKEIKDNYNQYNQLVKEYNQLLTDYNKLIKKLKTQPAEIVEKIRDLAGNYFYENSEEDLLLTGGDFTEILDTVLKDYEEK